MIKNVKEWEEFENKIIAESKVDFHKNLKIFQQLLNLAVKFKALPYKDPLEGLEIDIKIAKVINGIK